MKSFRAYPSGPILPIIPGISIFALLVLLPGCRQEPKDYLQGYYPLVYEGDLAFFKKDYQACYEVLKKAVALKRPPNFEPYRELEKLANVSAMLQKEEEAIAYIDELIARGYELETFQRDSSYAPVWKLPQWQALVEAYPGRRKAYLMQVDLALREQVIDMNVKDQTYRARPAGHLYRREQSWLDSANLVLLREIFETKGYPNPDLIGHESIDGIPQLSVENILLRSPDAVRRDYFIPEVRSFVEQGTCPPKVLGLLIDHYHLRHDGYQIYGTIRSPNGNIEAVKDPRRVEELRQSIGLPTLQFNYERDSVIRINFLLER